MKTLIEFPKYKIDTKGNIYNAKKKLTLSISTRGYLTARLRKDGKTYWRSVHRLLAQHYLSDFWEECEVDHIDGNKLNNDLSNLRCLTPSHHNSISPKKKYTTANHHYHAMVWFLMENRDRTHRIYNTKRAIQEQLGFTNREMSDATTRRYVKGWKAIACKLSSKPSEKKLTKTINNTVSYRSI